MRTDAEIGRDGVLALISALGSVEAERFISLINRERFNYAEWRATQCEGGTVSTLAEKARLHRAAGPR